jgi:hypothetical protein
LFHATQKNSAHKSHKLHQFRNQLPNNILQNAFFSHKFPRLLATPALFTPIPSHPAKPKSSQNMQPFLASGAILTRAVSRLPILSPFDCRNRTFAL